jgi:serine phosphatase RsbU (regulator of sigma subunit)
MVASMTQQDTGEYADGQDTRSSLDQKGSGVQPGLLAKTRLKLNALILRRTRLWEQVQAFGRWLELDAALLAARENHSHIAIELDDEGKVTAVRIGSKRPIDLAKYDQIWQFLRSLDLYAVQLDQRLEHNQIEDVFAFLYYYRKSIARRENQPEAQTEVGGLFGSQGAHIACTQTRISEHLLVVEYSYCTLGFSRVVHWLEKRNQHFRDHRVLFHMAPRYALLITALVLTPGMIFALVTCQWPLVLILVCALIALYGILYCFVMTVGSIEYDNEEKAYRLGLAYNQLKKYTTHIQNDIERARSVQQRFLPQEGALPFQDSIEWAASFKPAEEVAGDYYDVAALSDEHVAIVFSDVCGHGMAAAFVTAVIKTTFQAWVDSPDGLDNLYRRINTNLLRLTPEESFAAVFLAVYDRASGQLDYINGGHQPEPWHMAADSSRPIVSLSEARSLILGIEAEPEIRTASTILQTDDTVLFVSDGIIEIKNEDGEYYKPDQFEAFLQACQGQRAGELVQHIDQEVKRLSQGLPQMDDRTVLALSIRPST